MIMGPLRQTLWCDLLTQWFIYRFARLLCTSQDTSPYHSHTVQSAHHPCTISYSQNTSPYHSHTAQSAHHPYTISYSQNTSPYHSHTVQSAHHPYTISYNQNTRTLQSLKTQYKLTYTV